MKTIWHHWRALWLAAISLLYLLLAGFQLGLPGLHYDEAKEAGVNALELLRGEPVTAFRETTIDIGSTQLPLMVQDYIGALNIFLAWPFLALSGIGVPNLRFVGIAAGLAGLLLLERVVSEWSVFQGRSNNPAGHAQISLAGLISVTLLAASPSFVFWSRQGIFVTNLTQPLSLLCIWMGLHWLRTGRSRALLLSAFAGGLALYAKLLAIWLVAPFVLLTGGWWLWQRIRGRDDLPKLSPLLALGIVVAFMLPIVPLILFNLKTGGTWSTLVSNATQSYYGVDNRQVLDNLPLRLQQLADSLQGDHFWYLGALFGNPIAPILGLLLVIAGLVRRWQALTGPVLLLILAVGMSLFTVSDLFLTHYALLQPVAIGIIGISLAVLRLGSRDNHANLGRIRQRSVLVGIVLVVWLVFDLTASVQYHRALARSGGLADHSDASYHLSYHLRFNGLGAPIALDWGFDAPIRFLTQGTVRPIEIFGYTSPVEPDPDYRARLEVFIHNPDNVYLMHAPDSTVFNGRRDVFLKMAAEYDLTPVLEIAFSQRDGTPLFELWRLVP